MLELISEGVGGAAMAAAAATTADAGVLSDSITGLWCGAGGEAVKAETRRAVGAGAAGDAVLLGAAAGTGCGTTATISNACVAG